MRRRLSSSHARWRWRHPNCDFRRPADARRLGLLADCIDQLGDIRRLAEILIRSRNHRLLGREPRGIEVHRPIRSGTIFNFEVAQKMLRTFIGKVWCG